MLGEVRYTSSDDYTRVILDVRGGHVPLPALPPAPEVGRTTGLYVDLAETAVGKGVPPQVKVSDGILRCIRTARGKKKKKGTEHRRVTRFPGTSGLQGHSLPTLPPGVDVYAWPKREARPRALSRARGRPEPAPAKESRRAADQAAHAQGKKELATLIELLGLTSTRS